ncbi:hypothetical protein [uncultured Brevundimonas sp.]|uniref:hypothetical protein n=1 Tax=uncultured Brevundimonas sp. TaxID=213418 RepID=UPI0030ECDA7C
MASLTIKMSDEALRKLTAAARLAGVTPERLAETRLEAWAQTDDESPLPDHVPPMVSEPARAWVGTTDKDRDPHEDNAGNYDLNEGGRPWSEVRAELEALLERKLSKSR